MVSRVASSQALVAEGLAPASQELPRPKRKEDSSGASSSSSLMAAAATAPSLQDDDDSWMDFLSPLSSPKRHVLVSEDENKGWELFPTRGPQISPDVSSPKSSDAGIDKGHYYVRPFDFVYKRNAAGDLEVQYQTRHLMDSEGDLLSYEAIDCRTNEMLMLKTNRLQSDPKSLASCIGINREASVLMKLKDNYFAPLFRNFFCANAQQRVLVLEHLESRNRIDQRFKGTNPFEWTDLLNIAFQVVNFLHYFKEKGLVHNNLQTKKLYLDQSGQLKIVGFDQAYTVPEIPDKYQWNSYSAPETCLKMRSGCPEDTWSAGQIIAELATGKALIFSDFKGGNPITAITKYRGMPPAEWLDKSSIASQFFLKSADGQSFAYDERGLEHPSDRYVQYLTDHIERRWTPKNEFPEERQYLINLIDRMTSYQKRITPLQAVAHPLFNNYIFWQISKIKKSSITHLFISLVKPCIHSVQNPKYRFVSVDFMRSPDSRWFLHNCENQTSRYMVTLCEGSRPLKTKNLYLPPRAILQVSTNERGKHKLDINPVTYSQASNMGMLSSVSASSAASSSSSASSAPSKFSMVLRSSSKSQTLATTSNSSSSSSSSSAASATSGPQPVPSPHPQRSSLSSSSRVSGQALRKRSSTTAGSTLSMSSGIEPPRGAKGTKKM